MFDAEAIKQLSKAEAITATATAIGPEFRGVLGLPSDFAVHDLEKFLPQRRRARGSMVTSSVPDFAAYAAAHREDGACVFVDQDRMQATAVLNLGTPEKAGHADNRAALAPKKTAAFMALLSATSGQISQVKAAEFLEDWPAEIECFTEAGAISPPKAIAAIRKITIEAINKLESTAQNLSASRSAFEQVQAASGPDPLPTTIYFKCAPYQGMDERLFVLRLGVNTGGKDPAIMLRIKNKELHDEQMAAELAQLVRDAVEGMPVLVGTYKTSAVVE